MTTTVGMRTLKARHSWSHAVACLVLGALAAWSSAGGGVHVVEAADAQAGKQRAPHAPHGTPFHFEVLESHDADYLGDTPAHIGKDGGLTVRPQVALGDAVYRTVGTDTKVVGAITLVKWDRVSGSLTVEFDPQPFERIAVGDEVWIDLNPAPKLAPAAAAN